MDARDHLDRAKMLTELVAATFDDPNDCWQPVAFMFGGKTDGLMVKIGPGSFADDSSKNALAVHLAELIGQEQIQYTVMIQEGWVADREDDSDLSPARFDPARVDSLIITVLAAYDKAGSIAPITREKDRPPRLGEWADSEGEMDGRFVDPLVQALRAVRSDG